MDPVTVQLAIALASQGLRFWADFTDRAAAGHLTDAELDAAAAHLGANIEGLRQEIAEARKAAAAKPA